MPRSPKHTPEALLDLARIAVSDHPDVPVHDFRATHRIAAGEAQAVLAAARWELRHRQYASLAREDLHPHYRDLVRAPDSPDHTAVLTLDALPVELRASVDRALESARTAFGSALEALRVTARRITAEVETQAAVNVRTAEAQAQEAIAALDSVERQVAEAREETARVRENLGAEVLRLTQDLKDERRDRSAAERTLQLVQDEHQRALHTLDNERAAARTTAADLTRELSEAQKLAGAAELRARGLEEALVDTRQRLDDATSAATRAERAAAAAEARAPLLESAHAAELQRLREAHAAELQRFEDRVPDHSRQRRTSSAG